MPNKNGIWKFAVVFFLSLSISIFSAIISKALAQETSKLEKAQWAFQHENYEEALPLFKELQAENPQSSEIAYYLGLTYKRLQDYLAAKQPLEAAVTLPSPVKNALLELIDLLYQCDKIDEAKKWITEAEKEFVTPAQTAFFKGLVTLKEGKDPEGALKSFEEAEKLDPSLAQTTKYQKALAYMQLKNFKLAKDYFKQIVVKDPTADLAGYANEYINALTLTEEAAQPFHGNIGYALQYDDNVVYQPNDQALKTGVFEHRDWRHVYTAQADYNLKPSDFFNLKMGYSFYGTKQNYIGFYDVMSYDIPIQPVFHFEKTTVAFPIHYNYVSVNNRKYLGTTGLSNLDNFMIGTTQMLQAQFQYNIKDYPWATSIYDDKKTGRECLASLGWFNFFGKNLGGYVNLRFAKNYEDTAGRNWTYQGERLTFTSVVPLVEKLKWDFVFDYFRQDFAKRNTDYNKYRSDDVYTISNLLAYEIFKNTELQLQHTYVYDGASIGIYKYHKNVFGFGVKYQF